MNWTIKLIKPPDFKYVYVIRTQSILKSILKTVILDESVSKIFYADRFLQKYLGYN